MGDKKAVESKVEKGGFVIYGRNKSSEFFTAGQLCMVAGYTQNRFGHDNNKYYSLVKGSVDEGETPLKGARRETHEEAGVDVKKLVGANAYAMLKKIQKGDVEATEITAETLGQPIIGEFGNAEVKVKRIYAKPSEFSYRSASGKLRNTNMFFIELEDGAIDALQNPKNPTQLKRPPQARGESYNHTAAVLNYTAQDYTREHHFPTLDEMLSVLRTGDTQSLERLKLVTGDCTQEAFTKALQQLQNPAKASDLPSLEALWRLQTGKTIRDEESWVAFCRDIEAECPKEYKKLEAAFEAMKVCFSEIGLVGDHEFIKFDEKDKPLNFFFEGAEVLPINHVLTRSATMATQNPHYRDAMWRDYAHESQIQGLLPNAAQPLAGSELSLIAALERLTVIKDAMKWAEKDQVAALVDRLKSVIAPEGLHLK